MLEEANRHWAYSFAEHGVHPIAHAANATN